MLTHGQVLRVYIPQKKADLKLMFKSFTRPLVEKTIVVSIIAIPVIYIMLCMTISERTEHSDAVSNEFGFDYDDSFFLTETTGFGFVTRPAIPRRPSIRMTTVLIYYEKFIESQAAVRLQTQLESLLQHRK